MMQKITVYFLILYSCFLSAQDKDSSLRQFKLAEIRLKQLQVPAFHSRIEAQRLDSNKQFIAVWDEIVNNPKILNYDFDSIKEVSILVPKNKSFKLITWNLAKDDGSHYYFGYLLVNSIKRIKTGFLRHRIEESYQSFKLLDRSSLIKSPENHIGNNEKWFGMIYYALIECENFYTLLGYDPNDKLVRRKFVDVLSFKTDGSPQFGKDVFKFPRKNPKRLMFEYSSDVVMSLRYDDRRNQIVFSHLASNREGGLLDGQYQYYGPDGSFDALEMKKGKWNLIEDIDARNEKNKNDNVNKPDPKKQTPIFKPK